MYATVIALVNLLSFGISFNVATGSSFIFFNSLQEAETNIYLVPLSLYVNRHFPCLVSCVKPQLRLYQRHSSALLALALFLPVRCTSESLCSKETRPPGLVTPLR